MVAVIFMGLSTFSYFWIRGTARFPLLGIGAFAEIT
jgi:hypothetical protein